MSTISSIDLEFLEVRNADLQIRIEDLLHGGISARMHFEVDRDNLIDVSMLQMLQLLQTHNYE
jgi:hypothetical protein